MLISHRAKGFGCKENTLSAIHAAQPFHPDIIEIDVRTTRDGLLVLYHNRLYRKLPFRIFKKSQLPYEVPLLEEVLTRFPEQKFHLDIKACSPQALIQAIKNQESNVMVSSYNTKFLKKLKELNQKINTKLNNCGNGIDPVKKAVKIKASGIHVQKRFTTSRLIEKAHRNNLLVYAWTINSENDARKLMKEGIDGIITDRIDKFSKIFKHHPV